MTQLNNDHKNNYKKRYLINIYGVVQGIGFRPFVYNTAKEYEICGWVNNSGGCVTIDIIGTLDNIKKFILKIIKNPPSPAIINSVKCRTLEYLYYDDFNIRESSNENDTVKFILPDMSTCEDCARDIMNDAGRRYRYAFTSCTKCGPRYSVIKVLPYDRKNTTMDYFKMCGNCEDEYTNPLDRRFHSETNCCRECGPSLVLTNSKNQIEKCGDVIDKTIELIKLGKIVAIKGIGGFHLVCNGRNKKAIGELRNRKKRPNKPLAVMMKEIHTVKEFCELNEKEEQILTSRKKPIVLLKKKSNINLPNNIAPGQRKLGVMLPYTPIHYLILEKELDILIMTSANMSGSPIEYKNNSAFKNLKDVADYFLMHDREIYIPIDDPVVKLFNGEECVIRSGRGYAPSMENIKVGDNIIALGPEEKNSISLSKNGYVYTSQYMGNLQNFNCYKNYEYVLNHLCKLLDISPKVWVEDMHPFYISSKYGNSKDRKIIKVQHHHAHMASCMAEHNVEGKVIGVIYDGTGFGIDGNIWGGEFFIAAGYNFNRVGHFEYVSIQGGDTSIKQPWRCAVSYLYFFGYSINQFISDIDKGKFDIIVQALKTSLNCYKSSSVGRFFDCISALIGLVRSITYDGEAAIALENIMDENVHECYNYKIKDEGNVFLVEIKDIIHGVLVDINNSVKKSTISAKFHNTISKLTCDLVFKLSKLYKIYKVVLSGGVFENEHLLKSIYNELKKAGLEVFFNSKTPINDGGISFGQIVIADEIIKKEGM
ncbi:carbamoyltransferase HypF [Clostridium kluyveri]|uniref:carbamoyltransferase HypF n=1 Tax=Clostridium kluyveri TaxID=1534 RepID=UPI002247E990|nr:carbamoyltransferase HypF [Clostridium kluyveri]UZQ51158.1 carbamoyltransferase HypF [Clostridium kluyveri]